VTKKGTKSLQKKGDTEVTHFPDRDQTKKVGLETSSQKNGFGHQNMKKKQRVCAGVTEIADTRCAERRGGKVITRQHYRAFVIMNWVGLGGAIRGTASH